MKSSPISVAAPPDRAPSAPDPEPESLEGPADRRFLIGATVVGMIATGLACWLLDVLSHVGFYGSMQDALFITPYWQDAVAFFGGKLPYRDFPVEYPPLSLPVFLAPVLVPGSGLGFNHYRGGFEVVMAVIAIGLVPVVVATLAQLGARRLEIALGAAIVAVAPLLVGSLAISRYDLWPTWLTAVATLAMVAGRFRTGFAVLALAVLAKVYPAVLTPIFIAYVWRSAGRREAVVDTAIGAVVGLAGLVPFVLLDAQGALDPFVRAVARPLEVESLGASILAALHDWFGLSLNRVSYAYNSYNIVGPSASTAAILETILLVALLAAVWVAAARRPMDRGELLIACAAAICTNVAFGKVLSPQYVIWLIGPLAVLVVTLGARPLAGLAVVLVLTQLYYPGMFTRYLLRYDPAATVAILERNIGLVLLALYLAAATGVFARVRRSEAANPPEPPA